MKKVMDIALFCMYFLFARLVRFLLKVFDKKGPLDMAMISNYRDQVDVRKFGFRSAKSLPDVLSWTRYVWEGKYKARLFMIGSLTEDIGGDDATLETIEKASEQFRKAVKIAYDLGARFFLYAAANKRLPIWKELKLKYPDATFTLGDNFTGDLLAEQVMDAFRRTGLIPGKSRVLVIAPYGFLGNVAFRSAVNLGATVIGLGNPARMDLLERLRRDYGVEICTSFEEAGKVDMAVACNSSARSRLTPERVELLRRPGKRLVVIDPNEPACMPPELFEVSKGKVIRLDAGNGYSSALVHTLQPLTTWLLRLAKGITWGCFCETFIIGANPELRAMDWLKVNKGNMAIMRKYLGSGKGKFALPQPTCFNKPVIDFGLAEKSKWKMAREEFRGFRLIEGTKTLML